jgi:sugar O-acyltransferase (sialic acid O-acetyltransferase NeuD family)
LSLPAQAIIWGASGHATVVANAARLGTRFELTGFLDELNPGRRGESLAGSRVLGGLESLEELLASGVRHVLLGVGDNRARLRIAAEAERRGFELGTVVHPAAVVATDVELGVGTFVGAGAVINPHTRIGRATIINTNAVVEHHCEVGEGAHIAPGALLAGNVRVGRLSWIGIGAAVIEKREVGDESVVGAGAVVVRDVAARVVVFGNPARRQRAVQ